FYYAKRALGGPLAKIPRPLVARWTRYVLSYHILRGNRMQYINQLHNRYGPVVRVSPFEIAINDPDGVKTIQKVSGGFDKGPWYDSTGPGLLGMRDHVKHSRQRRLLAHPLINTSLMSFEPLVQAKINLAMDQIERECARIGVSDIYKWFSLMTTDIIGDLTFGSSFRMFERGEKDQYVLDLQSIMTDVHVRAELSPFINVLFYLPLPQAKEIQNRLGRIIEYGRQSMNRLRTAIETGSLKTPIFFSMIMDPKDTENSLTELEMQEEAAEFMITGTNTTSNTLTYLVWAILKHPQIRKRLEKEVAELSHNYTDSEGVREVSFRIYNGEGVVC
ncbi:cytochrome P450, partial [Dendryphion nanum]